MTIPEGWTFEGYWEPDVPMKVLSLELDPGRYLIEVRVEGPMRRVQYTKVTGPEESKFGLVCIRVSDADKCECGTGVDVRGSAHSDWCPLWVSQ